MVDTEHSEAAPPSYNEALKDITLSSQEAEVDIESIDIKMTKNRILKNMFVVSFAFMFLFTSFQSMSNLQSTLNKAEGLGTGGLAIVYAALIVSCMFLPSVIIAHLGCKWTIAVSMLCYILYMAANLHAVWGLMAPASVVIGLGAAPLWSAKCTYLTETALWYSKLTKQSKDAVINKFFGFFFLMFQTSQIWGNLISSTILATTPGNITEDDLKQCGAAFCPAAQEANNTNLDRPPPQKVYTLVGIYIGSACLAFLIIAVFLDKFKLGKQRERSEQNKKGKFSVHLLIETLRFLWGSRSMKLLIPLTIYSGVEQAFIGADYTKSFIACANGIWNVGYVMICYGVVDAICSFTFGRLVQYVGHIFFFVLAGFVHLGVQITLLLWSPHPDAFVVFFIIAALWGMGDAVWQTQINALYGYLFTHNPEAAFANYRLWESVGFIIAFAYSSFLCTHVKIYICMGVLITGLLGYFVVEVLERRNLSLDPSAEDSDGKRNEAPRKEVGEGLADVKKMESEGQVVTKF